MFKTGVFDDHQSVQVSSFLEVNNQNRNFLEIFDSIFSGTDGPDTECVRQAGSITPATVVTVPVPGPAGSTGATGYIGDTGAAGTSGKTGNKTALAAVASFAPQAFFQGSGDKAYVAARFGKAMCAIAPTACIDCIILAVLFIGF